MRFINSTNDIPVGVGFLILEFSEIYSSESQRSGWDVRTTVRYHSDYEDWVKEIRTLEGRGAQYTALKIQRPEVSLKVSVTLNGEI